MKAVVFIHELISTFVDDITCAFSIKNWKESLQSVRILTRKQLLRNTLFIVPQIALFYILLSPAVAAPFYNKLLFFPTKEMCFEFDKLAGIAKENVEILSANNSKLHAWYFPLPNPKGVVLISHGNGGNISHRIPLIKMFLQKNISVLAYDYQGYGRSEGNPSIENILADGLSVYDYLTKQRNVEPEKIIVYGESLGGAVTSHIATNRKVGAIILQSAFSSLPHIAKARMPLMRAYPSWLFPNKLDNGAMLAGEHAPLLIVHGKADSIIPFGEAELLASMASQPSTRVGIEGANHNDMYCEYQTKLDSVVSRFLETALANPLAH